MWQEPSKSRWQRRMRRNGHPHCEVWHTDARKGGIRAGDALCAITALPYGRSTAGPAPSDLGKHIRYPSQRRRGSRGALRSTPKPSRNIPSIRETADSNNGEQCIPEGWYDESPESVFSEVSGRRVTLLGLPCARCRAYYDATLDSCPICGCKERVSPQASAPIIHARSRAA